jgi:hypothetical protein
MRDKNQLNPKDLQESIKLYVERKIPERIKVLRNQIVDDPNFLLDFQNRLFLPKFKTQSLLSLAFLSWYIPEEIGVLLRLELQEYEKIMNKKDKILLRIFLSSYIDSITFIEESDRWHSRDFFGNFLKSGLEDLCRVKFKGKSRKVRKSQRKRGYHDHGSRRPDSKWLPSFDFTFTQKQNQKEKDENHLDNLTNRVQRILRRISMEKKDHKLF